MDEINDSACISEILMEKSPLPSVEFDEMMPDRGSLREDCNVKWRWPMKYRGIVNADSVLTSKCVLKDMSVPNLHWFYVQQQQQLTNLEHRFVNVAVVNRFMENYQACERLEKKVKVQQELNHCLAKSLEEINKAKGEYHLHSPHHVIKIDENGVLKVDERKTRRLKTFLKFCWNRAFLSHSTPENRLVIWAALYGVQCAQLSVLGNPLDKLSQPASIGTQESLLSKGKACSITIWTTMFFLNFIYATVLTLSSPYRIPAYSMLGLSLLYYIFALIVAMSGYSVSWGGSAQISGLSFVLGGSTGLMLLFGIIIMGVLYVTWCSSPNEVEGELTLV